ncbi:ABC transporter substrate-binding protein [Rhodoluna sp. KAS3]|uniref:ABC transporter substrate-binding protein n=1 Tax=Rhodoluna sp. KAS3 TaxID=942880 RepID=UPI0022309068|nr:ABC transporter substrate-binding protein [Rhodoluna sp. KAS3]BDS49622.1 lipoprotein [Rhodoluna sp. KAS3]
MRKRNRQRKKLGQLAGAILAVIAIGSALFSAIPTSNPDAKNSEFPSVIRIGYFANITHAPALIAVQEQYFEKYLPDTEIQYFVFPSGSAAVEAFKGGALDISYVGPNPAINGFVTTNGSLLRIVSGATSGGAQFVVQPGVTESNLAGKNFATPGLGGTQDVALRSYLSDNGLSFDVGGDVAITPSDNAATLSLFQKGDIDGAWVPEPWASRLVLEGGGKVLVNEADLWANGAFATTLIAATSSFSAEYPAAVEAVLEANLDALQLIENAPEEAKLLSQQEIARQTGKTLGVETLDRAWSNLKFGYDPLALTLQKSADDAVKVDMLKLGSTGLKGIYDLLPLNNLVARRGLPTADAAGLGS